MDPAQLDPAQLNPAAVEKEIVRLSNLLDTATAKTAERARDAAIKRVEMKTAMAKAFLAARSQVEPGKRPPPTDACEAIARVECEQQMLEAETADALLEAAKEAGRNLREQISAMRTLAANLRHLVGT